MEAPSGILGETLVGKQFYSHKKDYIAEHWHRICLRVNAVRTCLQFYHFPLCISTHIHQLACNFRLQQLAIILTLRK